MGRHRHQRRALDDSRVGRTSGRGARPFRTRTAEGLSRAQRRGQRMGRKPKLTEAQQTEARKRRAEGATLAELARSYGVGKSTISRLGFLNVHDQHGNPKYSNDVHQLALRMRSPS